MPLRYHVLSSYNSSLQSISNVNQYEFVGSSWYDVEEPAQEDEEEEKTVVQNKLMVLIIEMIILKLS